ncbi:hypothetical protein GCM10017784_35310 [Deinococcus indicus]|uniref:hypothetical protein n=1 Tax=Deinococcus indicus TaxID=223556 RepID=UPI00174C6B12|nr:hypothetical protein [Deinococcus indicus]GHG37785.1 hypothetical protein GCM10017784_35310 [Deinococcus indicus]
MPRNVSHLRRVMELAHIGTSTIGLPAAAALIELPIAAAQALQDMTDGPVRAYLAIGAEDVQALEAFMASRSPR